MIERDDYGKDQKVVQRIVELFFVYCFLKGSVADSDADNSRKTPARIAFMLEDYAGLLITMRIE